MANKTGDFDVLKLTNAGRDMLTQGRAGHIITFTKVVIGDGTATGSAIDSLTAVKSPKLTLPIAKSETVHAGQMRLQFRVSNSLVNTSFYFREIGLMAKVDNGPETLYAYTTCGDKAKLVYDKTYPIQEKIINIDTVTDNAVNVKVILDLSIMYATRKDIDTAIANKVDITSPDYIKSLVTNAKGLEATKGNNTKQLLEFITNIDSSDKQGLAPTLALAKTFGIVASKLDRDNGYVKFGNGFIIQWGLTWFLNQNTYCDVTLPISCNVLVALCSDDLADTTKRGDEFFIAWNSGYSYNNKTSIRFLSNRGNTGNFTWICIGKA